MAIQTLEDRYKALVEDAYDWHACGDDQEVIERLLPAINALRECFVFPPPRVTLQDIKDYAVQMPTGPLL